MSLYRVEVITIKGTHLGEADRLITSYSRQRGRHRAVARGVRRPRSRLAAGVQPFVHAELLCWQGRTLDGISQCAVKGSFRPLRESLEGMAAASLVCELVDAFAQEDDVDVRAFDLLLAGLEALAGVAADAGALERLLTSFQWKLLAIKGFRPVLRSCAACGAAWNLEATPRILFSLAEGGALCPDCCGQAEGELLGSGLAAGRQNGLESISRQTIKVIDYLIRHPLTDAIRVRLPVSLEGEAAALGRAFLTWILEKRLRSRDFLDLLAAPRLSSLRALPPAGSGP
ncbi:MAG: DNA repair protein RecO [Thermaerobacterales bacterium]